MELKCTTDSLVEVVVKKTTIAINPTRHSSWRIVILNTVQAQQAYAENQDQQLVINGPGEYEIEGVTVTALPTNTDKGEVQQKAFCSAIQSTDQSLLILPSMEPVEDTIIEQFGFVDALCVPTDAGDAEIGKSLTTLLKGFSDIKHLVLISAQAIDPKLLEDVSTTIDQPVSTLRLKDFTQNPEQVEVHLLTPA